MEGIPPRRNKNIENKTRTRKKQRRDAGKKKQIIKILTSIQHEYQTESEQSPADEGEYAPAR
jgi:hypothetical protein